MFCVILHLHDLNEYAIQQSLVYINSLIAMELNVILLLCMPNKVVAINAISFSVVQSFVSKELQAYQNGPSPLDAAISMALLRLRTSNEQRRIVIINAVPDNDKQYISIMNCIFSAQKLNVTIDSVGICSSIYLQQAAFITQGLYLQVVETQLLQRLLDSIPLQGVQRLKMTKVDFRATCFCHRHMIDIGFVCSVCLSIFCKNIPICQTCHTEFNKIAINK